MMTANPKKQNTLLYRLMAVLMAVTLVLQLCPIPVVAEGDDPPADHTQAVDTYPIGTPEDLITYAAAYYNGYRNPEDTLSIAPLAYDYLLTSDDFVGIGTESRPFAGKLVLQSEETFRVNYMMFGAVTTDMRIVTEDEHGDYVDTTLNLAPVSDMSTPLFADIVKKGENPANWKIHMKPSTENLDNQATVTAATYTYGGLIGTIWGDSVVSVEYTVDTGNTEAQPLKANVKTTGANAGLICGTLGRNAQLTVTLTGNYTDYTVTAAGGAAGGIVGAMRSGSVLILDSLKKTGSSAASIYTDYSVAVSASAATRKMSAPSRRVATYKVEPDTNPALKTPVTAPTKGTPVKTEPVKDEQAKKDKGKDYGLDNDTENAYASKADTTPAVPKVTIKKGAPVLRGAVKSAAELEDPLSIDSGAEPFSGCAGGLVGWAENATIRFADTKNVTVKGTVNGVSATGNVYGYYYASDDAGLSAIPGAAAGYDCLPYLDAGTVRFAPDNYNIQATMSGTRNGGLIGFLDSEINVKIADADVDALHAATFHLAPKFGGSSTRGGLVGVYRTDALANTLEITNLKVNVVSGGASGGLVGQIHSDQAAYVLIHDAGVKGGSLGGGLVGNMGEAGSFVDVRDNIYLSGSATGGLVNTMNTGVLRIQGVTDMRNNGGSNVVGGNMTTSTGQIVATRGNGLVYAVGTGVNTTPSANNGWLFYRSEADGRYDDIGDWGEVLRLHSTAPLKNDGSIVDESTLASHYVTLQAASESMSSVTDFARTALNVQLNVTGNQSIASTGALRFAGGKDSAALLASNDLVLRNSISLSGTGLTGLTRDDGSNAAFTGTFDGNGNTITLATGEAWGSYSTDTLSRGAGEIYRHAYTGLIAKTGAGATIQGLTVNGAMTVSGTSGYAINIRMNQAQNYYVGSIVGQSSGGLTLDSCTVDAGILTRITAGNARVGGAIGEVSNTAGTVTITGGSYAADLKDQRSSNGNNNWFGGVIGQIAGGTAAVKVDLNASGSQRTTLAGSYTNADASSKTYAYYGGLIGAVQPNSSNTTSREITIRNLDIEDLTVNVHATEACGGLLGFHWLNTRVTIGTEGGSDGIVIGANSTTPSVTFTKSSATNIPTSAGASLKMGGLVFRATGDWQIHDLRALSATFSPESATTDFGFVAALGTLDGDRQMALYHETASYASALLLELCGESGHYTLPAGLIPAGKTGNIGVYDEILAYAVKTDYHFETAWSAEAGKNVDYVVETPADDITTNGAAIVSVRAGTNSAPAVTMDGAGCNTYQNQTDFGKTAEGEYNANTRYYYNTDKIRAKASPSDAENLLLWSLNTYAHSSLKSFFTPSNGSTLSGVMDMKGLSYYPVKASGVSITGTLAFYNSEIETGENGTGNSDSFLRSTRSTGSSATQHYLMHAGLLLDCPGDLTATNLTLGGNVGIVGGASGFLVRGTFGGVTERSTATLTNITLNGALVRTGVGTTDALLTTNAYAPLLINRIGHTSTLNLNGIKTSTAANGSLLAHYDFDAYSDLTASQYAASSLIGDVGSDQSRGISLNFSGVVLDARTTALSGDSSLNTAYSTSRAIFSRATLLNSFIFPGDCDGTYNYEYDEDWGSGSVNGYQRAVTYGWEVSESAEYAGQETHYYNDTEHYTDPSSSAGTQTSFASGWLPYVYTAYNLPEHKHELKVNVMQTSLTGQCGKYNNPYSITDGNMLNSVAELIRTGTIDTTFELTLPLDLGRSGNTVGTEGTSMWCSGDADHEVFRYDGSAYFVSTTNPDHQLEVNAVRRYLAAAYYKIDSPIVLPASFSGLGAVHSEDTYATDTGDAYLCPYAFRGVITGNGATITLLGSSPLIYSANGCVVRGITVKVGTSDSGTAISIAQDAAGQTYGYKGGNGAYGAVIRQVMGGDNILDDVGVNFTDTAFSATAGTNGYGRLMAVGGYIGALVNGGVIFRNMAGETGLTSDKCAEVADNGWLYVNPIIGRVLAGYAFYEGSAYVPDEANVTLHNGTKNYSIPDLNSAGTALTVNATASNAHTVTASDAQQLYILSSIVNSGAGSAAYNAGTEQTYATIAGTPWIAYRDYTATRCGAYDEVGTSAVNAAGHDYYDHVASQDVFKGATKVPYIVRQYTSSSTAMYRARSLCGSSVVSALTLSGGTHRLPDGYRGIGSIYSSNNALRLQFKKLAGSSAVLQLNMSYQEYDAGQVSSVYNENYRAYDNAGFGLFNSMVQNSASETNCVENLTLSGSVFYDVRVLATGAQSEYGWDKGVRSPENPENNRVSQDSVLHTGGLAGTVGAQVYIKNVSLNNLTVEGAKYVGGLIGYVASKVVDVVSPAATDLSVLGGICAGGLIGYYNGGSSQTKLLRIAGASASPAVIGLTEVKMKGDPQLNWVGKSIDTNNFMLVAAGGLIGRFVSGDGASNKADALQIEYVNVSGGKVWSEKVGKIDDSRYKTAAGGLIGQLVRSRYSVSHCKVLGTDVHGDLAGGLFGECHNTSYGVCTDISVNGSSGKQIRAQNSAGGVYGFIYGTARLMLSSVTVTDYNILQYTTAQTERANTGGVIGYFYSTGSGTVDVSDSSVERCQIDRRVGSEKTSDQSGVGGVVGALYQSTLRGYNILLKDISVNNLNSGDNGCPGMILGFNKSAYLKIAGVSIQDYTATYAKKLNSQTDITDIVTAVGTRGNVGGSYGTNGYVVFADYPGAQVTPVMLTDLPDTVTPTDPLVTVSDALSLHGGSGCLTGDGMAGSVAELLMNPENTGDNIWDAITSNKGLYKFSYAAASATSSPYQLFKTYCLNSGASAFKDGMFSTFFTEMNLDIDTGDVAVLVLEEANPDISHWMINSYINLLANTAGNESGAGYNYASSANPSIYETTVRRVVYDKTEGTFSVADGAGSLKMTDGKFRMTTSDVDNMHSSFSLIDVAFKDPANASNQVYHLYVPVFVKKLMEFDFDIAAVSGADYISDDYGLLTPKLTQQQALTPNQPLIDNLGAPVTLYFRYTYDRTGDEWKTAAEQGDNLLQNYQKTLKMEDKVLAPGTSDLRSDTMLVLVDPMQRGTPYYARFGTAYNSTTGVLSLSAFNSVPDSSDAATAFQPKDFNDYLSVTATQSGSGAFFRLANSTGATVKDNAGNYYRVAASGDAAGSRYDLTFAVTGGSYIEETYYLTFFTEFIENGFSNYGISATDEFTAMTISDDPDDVYPARLHYANQIYSGNGYIRLILGDIFEQSTLTVTTDTTNHTTLMSERDNHMLSTTMDVWIKLSDKASANIRDYFSNNNANRIDVYQSFLQLLTRVEDDETDQLIVGAIPTNCNYVMELWDGTTPDPAAASPTVDTSYHSNGNITVTDGYVEYRAYETSATNRLNDLLYRGGVHIHAEVFLDYIGDNVANQFPSRPAGGESESDNGVTVSAESRIGFNRDRLAQSNNVLAGHELQKVYYRVPELESATLEFHVKSSDINSTDEVFGDYTKLGINAHKLQRPDGGRDPAVVNAIAEYDIAPIREAANSAGYDTIEFTLQLLRRTGTGADGYSPAYESGALNFSQYLSAITVNGTSPVGGSLDSTSLTFRLARTDEDTDVFYIPVDFNVLTGSALEAKHQGQKTYNLYSNYRMVLSVRLVKYKDDAWTSMDGSRVGDQGSHFIVYTNAKVYPDYLKPSS